MGVGALPRGGTAPCERLGGRAEAGRWGHLGAPATVRQPGGRLAVAPQRAQPNAASQNGVVPKGPRLIVFWLAGTLSVSGGFFPWAQSADASSHHASQNLNGGSYLPPPGATYHMSTTKLTVGQPYSVTFTKCAPPLHFAPPFGDRTTTYSKRRDATWTGQATPPVGVAGFATVRAYCWSEDWSYISFAYPRTFRITISTPYTLKVSPSTTVVPGTTLTIDPAHGSFCSSIDSGYIALAPRPYSYILGATSWPVAAQFFGIPRNTSDFETNENWTTTLTVPSTLASGTYYILAACGYSRTTDPGMFEPTPIKVEAAK